MPLSSAGSVTSSSYMVCRHNVGHSNALACLEGHSRESHLHILSCCCSVHMSTLNSDMTLPQCLQPVISVMTPLDMSSSLVSHRQHPPTRAILPTLGPCLASSIQHAGMSSPAHRRMRVSFSLTLMFVFTDISPRLSGTVLTSSL